MLALSDKLLENKSLMFAAAAIALLVAAVLLLLMFRLAFGRRLRLPGSSRGRIPRLGIVDAFDLDRQRQLVIVRRDNVEHLIMIGGPNDLVIESEIIRAEAREGRVRDKESREAAQAPAAVAWPPELEAPRPAPAAPQRKTQFTPGVPAEPEAPPIVVAGFDEPPPAPLNAAPAPRPPVFPLPPRRSPPPFPPPLQRTLPQREPLAGRSDLPQREKERVDAGASSSSGFSRATLATPFLRPAPTPRPAQAPAARPASPNPAASSEAPSATPSAAAPTSPAAAGDSTAVAPVVNAPAAPETEPSAPPLQASSAAPAAPLEGPGIVPTQDPLDSIEEEMAKLLGRGPTN
jgi:flagellar protein FliO/FliZ